MTNGSNWSYAVRQTDEEKWASFSHRMSPSNRTAFYIFSTDKERIILFMEPLAKHRCLSWIAGVISTACAWTVFQLWALAGMLEGKS